VDTGLINYLDGGGGIVESLLLQDAPIGIVGTGDDIPAGSLRVKDVFITGTGHGIAWRTRSDLTVTDTRIENTVGNGITFGILSGEPPLSQSLLQLLNVNVVQAGNFGVYVVNTASEGCANQLNNVNVSFAQSGGIVVLNSGVCIYGGVLSQNRYAGIRLENSAVWVEGTTISHTLPRLADGKYGDGVAGTLSEFKLVDMLINSSARSGVAAFGGHGVLGWLILNCNGIDLDVETWQNVSGSFDPLFGDIGGLVCGCGLDEQTCIVQSSSLAPPEPI